MKKRNSSIVLLIVFMFLLSACASNKDKKEGSVSINATIDETIENNEGSLPYNFIIKQVMSDDSIREYYGVIHVAKDGTLFTYGIVENNVDGLISVLQSSGLNTDNSQKTLVMRTNFDQDKDIPKYNHKITWDKNRFNITNQEIDLNN